MHDIALLGRQIFAEPRRAAWAAGSRPLSRLRYDSFQ
jgi:hypothetical protein